MRPLSRRELLYAAAATAVLPRFSLGAQGALGAQGEWLAGDFHCHSIYSHDVWSGPGDDNTGEDEFYTYGHTPGEQIALAELRGLDFLAITDHNRVESIHAPDYVSSSLVLVPGYEHSLPGGDHSGVFVPSRDLLPAPIDASGGTGAWLDEIHARGGMAVVNHPFYGNENDGDAIAWNQDLAETTRFDAVEVWNSMWLTRHEVTPVYEPDNHLAVRWWETTMRGRPALGASDNHWKTLDPTAGVGQPTTWVYAPSRTAAGVIAAVQAGRTSVSWQPPALGGPFLALTVVDETKGRAAMAGGAVPAQGPLRAVVDISNGYGMTLRLVSGGTDVVHESRVTGTRVEVPVVLPPNGHLRAELLLEERYALTALTSCVYAEGRVPPKYRREPTRGKPLSYDGSGFAALPSIVPPHLSCECTHA